MKRYLRLQSERGLGRWLDDVARVLIKEGTEARRTLEADLDGWSAFDYTDAHAARDASPHLQARIRTLFTGISTAPLSPALDAGYLGRVRCWR